MAKGKTVPSPIIKKVYDEHVAYFGEPDESFTFENDPENSSFPPRIDVFIWNANPECDVATLSTIGMSDMPMHGAQHRAELHLAIRKRLAKEEMGEFAKFMANMAMAPFLHDSFFDWFHTISSPPKIPLYSKAQCVWLHPPFVEGGWGEIQWGETEVRLLNLVPITESERQLTNMEERANALDGIDIFSPR